jgi:hypothetical protein
MPRRKIAPADAALQKLAKYCDNVGEWLDAMIESIWSHSPEAERLFTQARGPLEHEELERLTAKLLQLRIDTLAGPRPSNAARVAKCRGYFTAKGIPLRALGLHGARHRSA